MASAHRIHRTMLYADHRTIEFFAKVADLVGTPGKVHESQPVEIDGLPWNIIVSATSELLTVSVACKIQWPGCVYACATLTTAPGGHLMERFDSEHSTAVLATFPIPTIRRSAHPVRSMKLQVVLRAEPPTSLRSFNHEEFTDELSDVVLEVEGHKLFVHRVVLACMSPVFRSMLYGHFAEASTSSFDQDGDEAEKMEQTPERKVIPLPNKDLSLVLEMLSTIYPPQLEVHAVRAKFLLPLYMEYQMTHMVTKCERVLCESEIYTSAPSKDDSANSTKAVAVLDEAMDHLFLCSLYKLDRLQQLALNLVAQRRSDEFDQHVNYSKLSVDVQRDLFRARVYRVEKRADTGQDSFDHGDRTSTPERGENNPHERSSSP